MSLISFHRLLIATAIMFCAGFAFWEFDDALNGGGTQAFVIGTIFVLLTGGLGVYLKNLERFLGYDRT